MTGSTAGGVNHSFTPAPVERGAMSHATEIFRNARLLIEQHGEAAPQHAAVIISDLDRNGYKEAAENWRNIQAAVTLLRERLVPVFRPGRQSGPAA